jgi:hypothetical protein
MPVKEQATKQVAINALEPQAISSDTTTTGAIIDTKDYDGGLYFAMFAYAYTDGTYTMKIEHGDDSGLSDAADVDSAMLVYGTLPALTAALAEGGVLAKEGVHSTKRYVRVSIVSTSTTTGASLAVVAVAGAEEMPTAQS